MQEYFKMKKENKELAKKKKAIQRKHAKRVKTIKTICWIAIPCLVIATIVGLIVYGELRSKINYSAGLTDEGYIEGVDVKEYVQLGDYTSVSVKRSELVNEEMVQDEIDNYLSSQATLNEKSTKTTVSGDQVSIDFVGKIDGKEFDEGTATDYAVTIGSGTMIDDFEEQLIGHQVGDVFEVQVTFPEDYEQNKKLSGKDAQFEVTLKGIYESPELTDDYVKENLSQYASTVQEYYTYMEETLYEENLNAYAQEYIVENSTVDTLPENYVKKIKHIYEASYEVEYNYYNQLYYSYLGYYMWDNVYDYYDMNKQEYKENLENAAKDSAKFYMVMQAVFEKEGMALSEEEMNDYIIKSDYTENEIDQAIEEFGLGYWKQNAMADKVLQFLTAKITVQEN